MSPSDPPSYDEPRSIGDPLRNVDALDTSAPVPELPLYSPTQSRSSSSRPILRQEETKEFKYEVMKGNKAVVELIVIAVRSYSKNVPTFMQGSPVKGIVRLNLEKPDYIQSVDISILGQYITGANPNENLRFLEVSRKLWSPSDGHPRNTLDISQLSPSTSRTSSGAKFSGKLQGEYAWTFSLHMPSEVSVPSGSRKEIKTFSLPQTFNERHAHGSIVYEVLVKVTRSKWKTHYRIPAPFGYMPCIRPPPLPPLRQLAYQDGVSLVGPTVDLEGWYRCGPVKVEGKLFNNRPSDVACSLYLAKPLSYTRGSLIPFCLQLESNDQQALDLLSPPKSIVVRLKRLIQYHFDPHHTPGSGHLTESIEYSDRAVLWPSLEGSEDPSKRLRFVNGELHITPDTKPSSAVGNFRIQYSIVLLPFDAVGFDPMDGHPLIEQPVEMATLYGSGLRPKRFAPPGYESETREPAKDTYFLPESVVVN